MKNILVVDNNPVVLKMLAVFLEGRGHRVFTAEDGLAALEIIDRQLLDLAIIDLVMPNISGDKLCRIVRSRPQLAALPLVVYSDVEDEDYVLAVGADVCIAKGPFRATEHHLDEVLAHLENGTLGQLKGQLIGKQDLYKRQITSELLCVQRHYQCIFDEMSEGVMELTPEGRIFQLNVAACRLCRQSEEELLGRDFFSLFSATDGERLRRLLAEIGTEAVRVEADSPVFLQGRELAINFFPVRDEVRLFIVAILLDLSERKRYELELKRSNTDLEQFAYSVSHDMRQPLRMVSGHLQLLERSLGETLSDDQRDNLHFALAGARRMEQMIVSLLEFARLGRKPKCRLASRELVEEALAFLAPEISEVRAEVTVNGRWPEVEGRREELVRLFQNLLDNALKYRDGAGPPRVTVDSEVESPAIWRVVVSDNGLGIEPGQIDRLFRFFSRLSSAERFAGTGMGLALCRRIAEDHRGRIRAESEGLGRGSRFIVEIPLPAADQLAAGCG